MASRRSCPSFSFFGLSEMGWWMSWAWAASLVLGLFTSVGHGAELSGTTWVAEGVTRKGDVASFWSSSSTQRLRHKATLYRPGSLSALSRGLVANLSILEEVQEENGRRQERDASPSGNTCWGCCGTPNHTGSREPAKGGRGPLATTTPLPEPPRRNTTRVFHRPGAFTPLGKRQRDPHRPVETRQYLSQVGSSFGNKGLGSQGTNATERCRGCCQTSEATGGKPPGRQEKGEGSHTSEVGSSQRPWRPVLDRDHVPYRPPSQKGENSGSSFSGGAGQRPH